jgi:AraC-like DNA-binding protein
MTSSGKEFCHQHEIDWVDFSGNASIRAPGLHVRIDGQPDRFKRRGRPASVFERRSSRLSRVLLQHPGREWSVRECARASGLNEGHVSRIVTRLLEKELLRREGRRLFVTSPQMLLDAWRGEADFSKHRILRGHVPARSGEELLGLVSKRLTESRVGHAATGLGAAWLYDHFAMFRLVTIYVREWPTAAQLEHLHFREEPHGANVWLVLPTDDGVFEGGSDLERIPCVHPVQVYVDLKDQPERATEAAEHLKQNPMLLGSSDGAK